MFGRSPEYPENEMGQEGKKPADQPGPQGPHGASRLTAERALGREGVKPGKAGPPAESAEKQPLQGKEFLFPPRN